jgi:hypothetical protein
MTRFLGNWEVESDLTLPDGVPFLRYDHPETKYSAFLRNIPERRNDLTYLSMQIIFDAPQIGEAEEIGTTIAKEFLDYLTFVSNMNIRLRNLSHIFNWEPGTGMREAFYFASASYNNGPYDLLQPKLLDTIGLLQKHPCDPRLRRAMKWFANGIAARFPDDQFSFFWFVVELVAQLVKSQSPIPDRCPTCAGPLYCEHCATTPLHRPYPKQAIRQLFEKYVRKDPDVFYQHAIDARNMLMHGDEVASIETALGIEFGRLVDDLGRLAWVAILNQFVPALVDKEPMFFETNKYVHMTMHAHGHLQIGFDADLENPDPAQFPKVEVSIETIERPGTEAAKQSKQ